MAFASAVKHLLIQGVNRKWVAVNPALILNPGYLL